METLANRKQQLLIDLVANVQIDNLDLQYFLENSEATTFEELADYIQDNNGFDVEIVYYTSAIEFLQENDPSLRESLELASDFGFELKNLTSETLASLLASEYCRNEFYENETLITNYFEELEVLENED